MAHSAEKKLYQVKGHHLTLPLLSEALASLLLQDIDPAGANQKVAVSLKKNEQALSAVIQQCYLFSQRHVHDIQVRSVPIAAYAGLLRHFYLRIDDIMEIHPGTEQRLSLRGWHNETDVGSDRLEQRYIACPVCTNRFIDRCWQDTRCFNLLVKNCDQSLNGARQSLVVGTGIALIILTIMGLFGSHCRLVALFILAIIGLLLPFFIRRGHNEQGVIGLMAPLNARALYVNTCPHF